MTEPFYVDPPEEPCGHEECDMEPCIHACDDCGRNDGTHDLEVEH